MWFVFLLAPSYISGAKRHLHWYIIIIIIAKHLSNLFCIFFMRSTYFFCWIPEDRLDFLIIIYLILKMCHIVFSCKEWMDNNNIFQQSRYLSAFVASNVGAIVKTIALTPMDVIMTRLYNQG